MVSIGQTAKNVRATLGITQREAADRLEVSSVHLCNIENDKSFPSPALLARYREEFGVDLYVLAWCRHGNVEKLPRSVRSAARKLHQAWETELEKHL